MPETRCSYAGCDARIIFAWTGRATMPLDAEPNDEGNVEIIDGVAVVHGQVPLVHGPLWMPHFATCLGLPENRERAARAARDEALARVEAHADPTWKAQALAAVRAAALRWPEITPDDVWDSGLPKVAESRALGPVMLHAARQGWIRKTDRVRNTRQAASHAAPVSIWESLIYRRQGTSATV